MVTIVQLVFEFLELVKDEVNKTDSSIRAK